MERCEIRAFQFLKLRKKNISWNIKIKYVTDIFFSVSSCSTKNNNCQWEVST